MSNDKLKTNIYTIGGVVQAGSGLYIERASDLELLELCRSRSFTYVLTPRQMGKSSLMVRTAQQLEAEGVRSVIIDLNEIGVEQITAEQWYLGLLIKIEEQLHLETNVIDWWQAHAQQGLVERLTLFFREVLLAEVKEPVVIFVDEIDNTLSLGFTDDFYAAIRALYHARARMPEFKRLSFILIGVATPSDLMRDPQRTPFNIGQRVDLTDFTVEEARPLAEGLGLPPAEAQQLLDRVLEWTGGHPYLTQRLLQALSQQKRDHWLKTDVDQVVAATFFGEQSTQDANLKSVRDMLLLRASDPEGVLNTYREILRDQRPVPDEEQSLIKSHLKLSGIVRREDGALRVRNRIYREIFNEHWVKEHLPVNWMKRLTRVAAALILTLLILSGPTAIWAYMNKREAEKQRDIAKEQSQLAVAAQRDAEQQRDEANRQRGIAEEQTKIAGEERDEAQKQKTIAEEQTQKALIAAKQEQVARKQAEERRVEAEHQRQRAVEEEGKATLAAHNEAAAREIAYARQLASQALNVENPQMKVLLARESLRKDNSILAYQALSEGLGLLPRPLPALDHKGEVYSVAFSPDGNQLATIGVETPADASANRDETRSIQVWDAATGQQLSRTGKEVMPALAQSPGGKYLATANMDETATIWEWQADALHEVKSIPTTTRMEVVAISPNGKYLAATSSLDLKPVDVGRQAVPPMLLQRESELKGDASRVQGFVWNVTSGSKVAVLSEGYRVTAIAFSPNEKYLAVAGIDGEVRVWGLNEGGSPPHLFSVKQEGVVYAVAFSPSSDYLATAGGEGTARVWGWKPDEKKKGQVVASEISSVRHQAAVRAVAFSPDGNYLATASNDNTARVWANWWRDKNPQEVIHVDHQGPVIGVAFSPAGDRIATASDDHTARVWNIRRDPGDPLIMAAGSFALGKSTLSVNNRYGAVAKDDGETQIWDTNDRSLVATLTLGKGEGAAGISADGKYLATAQDASKTIRVWDVARRSPLPHSIHYEKPSSADLNILSPDGKYLVTEAAEQVVLWDAMKGSEITRIKSSKEFVYKDFSPDGKYLVTATEGTVRLWEVPGGRPVISMPHAGSLVLAFFSLNGKYLATGGSGSQKVWEIPSGQLLMSAKSVGLFFAISSGGEYLATICDDDINSICLWGVSGGKLINRMKHDSRVDYVEFSQDGKYVVVKSNSAIHVWETDTGCEIARIPQSSSYATLSPNGKYIISAGDLIQMRLWKLNDLVDKVCSYVTRNLSYEEWHNQFLIEGSLQKTCPGLPQDAEPKESTKSCKLPPN